MTTIFNERNDIASEDFQISHTGYFNGKIANVVSILGRRTTFNSATTFQDICNYLVGGQSLLNTPLSGTTYYLVSTSASDAAGGAGAVTVRIVYLDVSGNQQVVTKTLTGTTPVNIGAGYSFIQWMEVASLTGNAETSAGAITISSTNGVAIEATTVEFIRAGGNRSLSGRYKVPTGYSAYLTGWWGSAINQDMDIRLRATVFADDHTVSSVYHFNSIIYLALNTSSEKKIHSQKCPGGSLIKASVIPSVITGSPRCDIAFHLLVIQN